MQSSVYLSYALEDAAAVEDLKSKLTVANLAPLDRDSVPKPGHWEDELAQCALFLACCGSSFAQEEVSRAIELLRREPRPRAWLIVVQLTPGEIPERLGGFPLILLHADGGNAIAQIISLIEPVQAWRTTLDITAGDASAGNATITPTTGASTRFHVDRHLTVDGDLVIGDGLAPQRRNQ